MISCDFPPAGILLSSGFGAICAASLVSVLRGDDAIAALAQVVEHIIRNDGVAGSSPASGTKNFPIFTVIYRGGL
jgi:hypothetical protein